MRPEACLPERDLAALARLARSSGYTVAELVSGIVSMYLRDRSKKKRRAYFSPKEVLDIRRRRARGHTWDRIAYDFGVSHATVRRAAGVIPGAYGHIK